MKWKSIQEKKNELKKECDIYEVSGIVLWTLMYAMPFREILVPAQAASLFWEFCMIISSRKVKKFE